MAAIASAKQRRSISSAIPIMSRSWRDWRGEQRAWAARQHGICRSAPWIVFRSGQPRFDLSRDRIGDVAELVSLVVQLLFGRTIGARAGVLDAGVEDDLAHGHAALCVPR